MYKSEVALHKSRAPATTTSSFRHWWQHGDRLYQALLVVAALVVLTLVIGIGFELWQNSALSRQKFGLQFLWTTNWDPAITKTFGALPFIMGTLVTSVVALVVAIPLGIGSAIFLAELAPDWLSQPLGFLAELLAAVPSVVYGLWGLFTFIPLFVRPISNGLENSLGFLPLFAGPVYGPSRLAASLVLAIMVFPTITAVSRDVLRAIPNNQREAALALGATRWEMIYQVLLPYGTSGFLGAIILGLGRALGETIAVALVVGNQPAIHSSLLQPGYTIPALIANTFREATNPLERSSLLALAMLLVAIAFVLAALSRLIVRRSQRVLGSGPIETVEEAAEGPALESA